MNTMMFQVCEHVRNFFEVSQENGDFSVSGGKISLENQYKTGQYVLLTGSVLVDGIYKITAVNNGAYTLEGVDTDEEWTGIVYGLRIPLDFIKLCGEIYDFQEKEGNSILVSETVLGFHSWSKGTGANKSVPADWTDRFSNRLNPYRKMFLRVDI